MKIVDHRSLPPERLATTDEKGKRVYLFPAQVKGFFRKRRDILNVFLIAIFLMMPWIKIGGVQSILIDIPNRRFALFGFTFWSTDIPILFFVLLILVIGLVFVTAIWGRVWCGWACPQTVFIDGVFRKIERWVIGSHVDQRTLAKAPWSFSKIKKLSIKWSLFLLVSLILAHSFLAYFVGAENLPAMMSTSPAENWTAFLVMLFTVALVLFDFAWFREQFCIIMCPYGRLQSAFLDESSLAVLYDEKRGEPRWGPGVDRTKAGDCVNCYRCVSVCPTGIDIRRGVQLECIACTACIDVCDEVMANNKKPKGLIRYDSIRGINGEKRNVFTPRLLIYTVLLMIGLGGLIWKISTREVLDVAVLRGVKEEPFKAVENEPNLILNHFRMHIRNRSFKPIKVRFELVTGKEASAVQLIAPINPFELKSGERQFFHFFVKLSKDLTKGTGRKNIYVRLHSEQGESYDELKEITLVGPFE